MPPLASITGPLVDFATSVIGDLGLAGVCVLMLLESACIPIPSEATMMFAGFNVSSAHHPHPYTLVELVAVGSVANLVGSWIAYAVGYYGRVDLLEKHGGKLHIRKKHLETADRWFRRHGDAAVFFTRMLPIVRTFISLPAGVARMPFWRFTFLTAAGSVIWMLALTLVGFEAGSHWTRWKDRFHYVDYVFAALILAARTLLPPGAGASLSGRSIGERLGSARAVAGAQVAGGVLLALADRSPASRDRGEAGAADALVLGVAQASALAPGVSRNGAMLTAA